MASSEELLAGAEKPGEKSTVVFMRIEVAARKPLSVAFTVLLWTADAELALAGDCWVVVERKGLRVLAEFETEVEFVLESSV